MIQLFPGSLEAADSRCARKLWCVRPSWTAARLPHRGKAATSAYCGMFRRVYDDRDAGARTGRQAGPAPAWRHGPGGGCEPGPQGCRPGGRGKTHWASAPISPPVPPSTRTVWATQRGGQLCFPACTLLWQTDASGISATAPTSCNKLAYMLRRNATVNPRHTIAPFQQDWRMSF